MFQLPLAPAPILYTSFYADPVQAGFPSPAQGYKQKAIDLNELMVTNPPATYFVRAQGDSMVDAGIRDGDMLVVDFSHQPKHGDMQLLSEIYKPGYLYKKAGVMLAGIETNARLQTDLFAQQDSPERNKLMQALDVLNNRYGRGAVQLGTAMQNEDWRMCREKLSPCYTTRADQVLTSE